jgi:DNA polymerase
MGYAGGVGAYITMAAPYNVDLDDLASKVLPSVPSAVLKEADNFYHWQNGFDIEAAKKKAEKANDSDWLSYYAPKRVYGIKQDTYVAIESLKRMWREEHPSIVRLWRAAEDAVRSAVNTPSKRFYFGNNCYACRVGNWLRITPPSSRSLCYPGMRVDKDGKLVFWGTDSYTKRWRLIETHGGKLIENLSQGLSMSVFKHGRKLAEQSGYAAVLQVHDELVCEVPDTDSYNLEGLISFMTTVPEWTPGLPLAAEGFEDYRYHK